jgi:hypothetical protein
MRFGLLTLMAAVFVGNTMLDTPISFDSSRWYASTTLFVPILLPVLAAWSFYSALGAQKLWSSDLEANV